MIRAHSVAAASLVLWAIAAAGIAGWQLARTGSGASAIAAALGAAIGLILIGGCVIVLADYSSHVVTARWPNRPALVVLVAIASGVVWAYVAYFFFGMSYARNAFGACLPPQRLFVYVPPIDDVASRCDQPLGAGLLALGAPVILYAAFLCAMWLGGRGPKMPPVDPRNPVARQDATRAKLE